MDSDDEAPQQIASRLRPRTAVAGRRTKTATANGQKSQNGESMGKRVSGDELAEVAVPRDVPDILELKRALPPHVFRPSALRSMLYVAKDWAIIAALYAAVVLAERQPQFPPILLKCLVYPVYWFIQGTMFWAVFVLGHDCGHGSFSSSSLLNDLMGNLLHAPILVPYYPWKVSHRKHHKNTGNIDKDEIFYPVREKDATTVVQDRERRRFIPLFGLGVSWFYYLARGYKPRPANHLNPLDPLFARHAVQCAVSLIACAAWVFLALAPYAAKFGALVLAAHYGAPIFVFATWLVVTTFLHHQDENVPWYSDERWDYVRGNLSSVDRDYGWAHSLTHNIGTHQIHHLFTLIPHYHLEEATAAFRAKYPHLVRQSREPILKAFCRLSDIFDRQQWVADDAQLHVYSSKK